jgi:hypothetical protein
MPEMEQDFEPYPDGSPSETELRERKCRRQWALEVALSGLVLACEPFAKVGRNLAFDPVTLTNSLKHAKEVLGGRPIG